MDGFTTGPGDRPGCELGAGGERLHHWVFGGPRSYDPPGRGEPAGEDKAWLQETMRANSAVIAGRGTCASSEVANERSPTASARTWNPSTCSDSQAVLSTSGTPQIT